LKRTLVLATLILFMLISGCTKAKKIIIPPETNGNRAPNVEEVKQEELKSPETVPEEKTSPVPKKEPEEKPTPAPKIEPSKKIPEQENYFVKVDISDQKVYVFEDDNMVKSIVCSTGIEMEETKTPRGSFIINKNGTKRGDWFYSDTFEQGAKYWVGFIGGEFLFHSVPMDKNRDIIQSEAEKLGTPASHGCVRISIDDAKWFYNTVPKGTNLLIQD